MQLSSPSKPLRTAHVPTAGLVLALAAGLAGPAAAFDSGSTGADGALAPTVNTQVELPPSGVLNYTSISIPAGVTVTFKKNVTNTPVVLLVGRSGFTDEGNVTIAGTLSVSGGNSPDVGAAGNGNLGDDGLPGAGGPGGYAGGLGSRPGTAATAAGDGLGPGAGRAAIRGTATQYYGGGGAGYGAAGTSGTRNDGSSAANAGAAYGAVALLPLLGGSGGGGGVGGLSFAGAGGGGGGGALLIAASGTINVTGAITANGGTSGATAGAGCGSPGGGGSGGAIRLLAKTLTGNGTINARGGAPATAVACVGTEGTGGSGTAGTGAVGRIRLEAPTINRTAAANPPASVSLEAPGPIFIAGLPTLTITSVAGVPVPAAPTGVADVSLPTSTTNPVAVTFQTTGVPAGNTVTLKVTPAYGTPTSAISTALTGDTNAATAGASITLPTGASSLQASVTYTIVVALGDALARYAQNERVERITLTATPGGASRATLITVSGREFDAPAEAMRIASMGG